MISREHVICIFAITLAILVSGTASAALVLYEPFNYTANQGLAGQNGQAGVGGTTPPPQSGAGTPYGLQAPNGNYWMTAGYSGYTPYNQANDAVTNSTDLSYMNLVHTPSGSVQMGGNGSALGTTARLTHTSFNNSADGSPVNVYYSLIVNISSLATTAANGGIIGGFNNTRGSQSGSPASIGATLFAKASGGGFQFGVLEQGTNGLVASFDGIVRNFNQSYFIVGKYTINGTNNVGGGTPTTDDTAQIWINPLNLGGAEPGGALVAANNVGDLPTNSTDTGNGGGNHVAQSFILRRSAANTATNSAVTTLIVDELRVGGTYADVTPVVPEPGAFLVWALIGMSLIGVRKFLR